MNPLKGFVPFVFSWFRSYSLHLLSSACEADWAEQRVDLAGAVGERIETNADSVEQRQVQIRQRRRLDILDVPAAANLPGSAAGDDDRQVDMVVNVGITHAAAVQIQRMVEQCAVAIGDRGQPLEEITEERHVELIDLRDFRELLGIAAV